LTVAFTQDVKALDFAAGVVVKVSGKPIRISSVSRAQERDTVRYILDKPVRRSVVVTWAYSAGQGNIANLSGDQLRSVSEKRVISD